MQHDRVEGLAKQAPALAARNQELHLDTVDLSAQPFDGPSGVDLRKASIKARRNANSDFNFKFSAR